MSCFWKNIKIIDEHVVLYVNSLFCLQAVQKLARERKSQGRKEKDETTKERERTTKEAEEKVMILCT